MSDKYQDFFSKISTPTQKFKFAWFCIEEKDVIRNLIHRAAHITDNEMEEIFNKYRNNTTVLRAIVKSDFVSNDIIKRIFDTKPEKIVYKEALTMPLSKDLVETCILSLPESEIEEMFDKAIMENRKPDIDPQNINLMAKCAPDKFNYTHFEFISNNKIVQNIMESGYIKEEKLNHLLNNKNIPNAYKDIMFHTFGGNINFILNPTTTIAEEIYKSSAETLFECKKDISDKKILGEAEENIKKLLTTENLPSDLQWDLYMRLNAEPPSNFKDNLLYVLAKKATDVSLLSNHFIDYSIDKRINTNKHFPLRKIVFRIGEMLQKLNATVEQQKYDTYTTNVVKEQCEEIANLLSIYDLNNVNDAYFALVKYGNENVFKLLEESIHTPIHILEKIKDNSLIAKVHWALKMNDIDNEIIEEILQELNNDTPFSTGYGTCSTKEKLKILSIFENIKGNEEELKVLEYCCKEIKREIERERNIYTNRPDLTKYMYELSAVGIRTVVDAQKFLNEPINKRIELLNLMSINSIKKEIEDIKYLFNEIKDKIIFYETIDKYIDVYNIFEKFLKDLELENSQEKIEEKIEEK